MTWTNIGPMNTGGCMLDVVVDPSATNRIYAIAAGGGCWRCEWEAIGVPQVSGFGSALFPEIEYDLEYIFIPNWRPLTDRLPLLYMTAVALCANRPQTLYCATGQYGQNGWPAQVWRSDSAGDNWRLPSAQDFGMVYRLAVDQDDPECIYAATGQGLVRSLDGGLSWWPLASGRCYDVAVDPDDSAVVYAGLDSVGVIQTTNARWRPGASLEQRMPPFWLTVLPWSQASAPINTTIRIGLGAGMPERRTVVASLGFEGFISHDSGAGWKSVGSQGRKYDLNLGNNWAHVAAADPHDSDRFLLGAQQLILLTNEGANAATVAGYESSGHPDQQQVVYDRRQAGLVYLANDGGVWISVDHGATWHDLNLGLITSEIATVGVSGTAALGDQMHGGLVGTTSFPSPTWSFYQGGSWELAEVHGDPVRPGRFFVFGGKLGLQELSVDSVPVIEVVENTVKSVQWVKAEHTAYYEIGDFAATAIGFDVRPGSNTIVVGTDQGDLMVTQAGESPKPTWTPAPGMPHNAGITSIVFPPSSPGRCLALAQDGSVYLKNEIHDAGSWTRIGAASNDARQLAVSSYDENRLYALHPSALEMSDTSARTWRTINGSGTTALPTRELKTVFATPSNPAGIIVGTTAGIFISYDFGSKWEPFDSALPNCEYKEIFMANDVLYVTTYGRGIWREMVPAYYGKTSDFSRDLHFRVSEIVK